jgi:uncharacterized protein YcbK (DUF882 family)
MKTRTNNRPQAEAAKPAIAISRRHLIKIGAIAAAAVIVPGAAAAAAEEWLRLPADPARPRAIRTRFIAPRRGAAESARKLSFYNPHTGENLNTVYWENGEYVAGALNEVNYFFRDFRANEVKPIDPGLLDLLSGIHREIDSTKPFNLVSGYRSPATNTWLASLSEGVARHSMHVEGRAADINLPGRQLSFLERIALALRLGGVGYYPRSGFVHVDTGRVRHW